MKDKTGSSLGEVTVLDVEKNPTCTTQFGTGSPPKGTNVAIQLRVETPTDYDDKQFIRTTERDFSEVNSSGVTKGVGTDSDLCIADRDGITQAFTASSKYEGWILLDVSDLDSKLIYRPQYSLGGPSYQVADLSTVANASPADAPAAPVESTVAEAPEQWTPVAPTANSVPDGPIGFTGAPIGDPQPLVGKVIDYCMEYPTYQNGTTMFTDGTTGWTQQCANGG
ncbi:hypothetical protein ACFWMS_28190 [Peribacillus butanolivorans]|uniref:hypothetical protein n=1 Tax=Peribacillus butanolivorans TaxID=421767 RepID=UPI0036685292